MVQQLTERRQLIRIETSTCTLVTYPQVEPTETRPIVTNPDLYAELGLFLTVLSVGFVLTYVKTDDTPKLFDYGTFFFNAGVIPLITLVIAPFVRVWWNDSKNESYVEVRELIMYFLFVLIGAVMIGLDRDEFSPSSEDGTTWRKTVGGSMLEAGLVYFAIRSFLLNEAPEDRARRVELEVAFLRESVSKGISMGYYLNFLRWTCKDMTRSREANNGRIEFQPAQKELQSLVVHIPAIVVIVPMLELDDFDETKRRRSDIISVLQDKIEEAAVGRAVRGHIYLPPDPNSKGFSHGHNILKLTVVHSGGTEVTVIIDIPSTLLAIWTNTWENTLNKTAEMRYKAYTQDACRFSSQLVRTLQKSQDSLAISNMVVLVEYEGIKDTFYSVLETALLSYFFPGGNLNNMQRSPPPPQQQLHQP
jgi:hypothetical protein